ncbi:signal peptide protein [Pandoraea horticolens]|uniref:Signal peptide protein n=1 Tax=Pandoraea horticolens TaxID=2508298 RepID=A0A5E4V524_9BURK|nr:signal peptide protein [Pandoraea horticolens]
MRAVLCSAVNRRYRLRHSMARRTIVAAFVLTSTAWLAATGAAFAAPASGVRAASPVYVAPTSSQASPPDWQARDWAMACMSCHNVSAPVSAGKAALPTLEGRPVAELMTVLQAMRDARRPATLMPQLLKGYRDDELQRIAAYFAAQPAADAASASARQSR